MLRLFAALIFIAIGGLLGVLKTEKLSESYRICDEIGILIERLSFMVGYRSDDVYTICRRLKSDEDLDLLKFIAQLPENFRCGEIFHTQWAAAVESQRLDSVEAEILLKIGNILGKTNSSCQVSALNEVKRELAELSERRKSEYLRKSRLYRSAGFLMGAMAGIIVI